MPDKRMINKKVVDTDAFLEMPLSAQALYFWLNLRADDDGFVSNPNRVRSYIGASEDDLKLLVAKRFVLTFPDSVMVIKHWLMHNTIQKDRYHPTYYQEDLKLLGIKPNKSYTLEQSESCIQIGNKMDTECIQSVSRDLDIDLDIDLEKDNMSKKLKNELYDEITKTFNKVCVSLPKITILNDKRKKAIERVFLRDKVINSGDFESLCKKVEESDFLSGREGSWRATFDWVMNPNNIAKVLDGNYENRKKKVKENTFNQMIHTDYDFEALEKELLK